MKAKTDVKAGLVFSKIIRLCIGTWPTPE